jgi:hypothetical protein
MHRSLFSALCLTLVLVAGVGAACSSSESPQEAVCNDAGDLKDSVNQLIDSIKKGNFGDAQDQITEVKSDFAALESSAKDLASSQKSSVQDDLDAVQGTLGNLTSASSLDEIESTLSKAGPQLKDMTDSVADTLSC